MDQQLPTTVLGRTGLTVTRLGIGGAYCPSVAGYRAALDTGATYVDTARAYRDGDDERVVGEALVGRRQGVVLATKTMSRDAAGARKDLETSLRLLRTDYVDVWQIHYLNTEAERERVLGPGGAMEAAVKARDQGLVRYIGVTGHPWAEIAKAVATGLFDTVLCWHNAAYREAEGSVFPQALANDAGVIIMNATRNGKLFGPDAPPAADLYRYVLSHEAVDMTVIGLRDIDLFRQMALALAWRDTLSPEERAALEAYGARQRAAGKLEM